MDFSALSPYYQFKMPEYYRAYASTFTEDYADRPFVSEAELNAAEAALAPFGLPQDCFDFLRKETEELHRDLPRNRAARFLRYIVTEARQPWDNNLGALKFDFPDYQQRSFELLTVIAVLGKTLTSARRAPEEFNPFNFEEIASCTLTDTKKDGFWNVREWRWQQLLASGCMYRLGILRFQPKCFPTDYYILSDGKRTQAVMNGGRLLDEDGCFVRTETENCVKTVWEESSDAWIAHAIAKDGTAERTPRLFPKSEWHIAIAPGDMVLSYHIPNDVTAYTVEEHRKSFTMAAEFFKGRYPQYDFKGIICASWLYSPQNKHILKPESNIIRVAQAAKICPIPFALPADLFHIKAGTPLAGRIADFIKDGGVWYEGLAVLTMEEGKNFGS